MAKCLDCGNRKEFFEVGKYSRIAVYDEATGEFVDWDCTETVPEKFFCANCDSENIDLEEEKQ